MIKNIKIDNFKSLNGFSMDFNDLTVVIGSNAAGKSSLLQALVLLRYCCVSDTEHYLSDRGLDVDAVVSRLPSPLKRIVSFETAFRFDDDKVVWKIGLITEKKTNTIKLQSESVVLYPSYYSEQPDLMKPEEITLLSYTSSKGSRLRLDSMTEESIPVASYDFSLIRLIDGKVRKDFEHLWKIRRFFMESEPLDLLAPQDMRRSGRGSTRTLGMNGSKLPALINQLSADERKSLADMIRNDLPRITDIQAVVHGKPGWAHLETAEYYGDRMLRIPANGISDGTLRLIALYSLYFIDKKRGMTLLDEIEDGINTRNLENVCRLLKEYTRNKDQQVLVTTHSTVMLDYFDAADIRYLFRDGNGNTVCRNFTDPSEIREKLEYLYPGEVVLSADPGEMEKIMSSFGTEAE